MSDPIDHSEPQSLVPFADGIWPGVYRDGDRHFVIGDDSQRVYGVLHIVCVLRDECDEPVVVATSDGQVENRSSYGSW